MARKGIWLPLPGFEIGAGATKIIDSNMYAVQAYAKLALHEGFHDWELLQGRYALCLLFEYAATLGLIDVAYVAPAGVRRDFRSLWGTDDLDFLSRYDGLLYFRLNPLGAYCLGLAETYEPRAVQARAALTVLTADVLR